jgi:hypothetical protein
MIDGFEAAESAVGLENFFGRSVILLGPDLIGERGADAGARLVPTDDGRPLRIG